MPPSDRQISLDLVEYVDGRMQKHMAHVESILREHVADEMTRFGAIQLALDNMAKQMKANHTESTSQWGAFATRVEAVERAFIDDARGRPDYSGHHRFHGERKASGAWMDDIRNKVITAVLVLVLVGGSVWTTKAVWQAALQEFLQGPQGSKQP